MKEILDNIFYKNISPDTVHKITNNVLDGFDDGEMFLEYTQTEGLGFDDSVLKNATYNTTQGFGLRSVMGELSGYAHSSNITEQSMRNAAETVRSVKGGHNGVEDLVGNPSQAPAPLYVPDNPISSYSFDAKVDILKEIDDYLRTKDERVKQVSCSIGGEWQAVKIIRAGGFETGDIRPLVRMNISVVVEKDGVKETGSYGCGGRAKLDTFVTRDNWQKAADEALRQALVNLEAKPSPAGEMTVILGNGWPGVMLHEAVGHGLEGDFNRKKTSIFHDQMGKQVASKGVTVVDNGTMPDRRGSITVDDEGTASANNILIEDGILTGFMQDRLNARLMGVKPTGNGRRESYQHQPMPRMTNTYMLAGNDNVSDMIANTKRGIYAVNFGGGQVDITSGKFVFSAQETYMIEDGKITHPVKGATLIGNGPDVMKKIKSIGNDLELDHGIGTCGKDGQGVPVGVGQPSMLIDKLTVGGTAV